MGARSDDAAKDIARLALNAPDRVTDTAMLESVLSYVWDQLAWRKTTVQLEEMLENLRPGVF